MPHTTTLILTCLHECSVLIVLYVSAIAYSIYSLIPRKTDHDEEEKGGCVGKLTKFANAVQTSRIFLFYERHRNPWIPLVLQLVEIIFQIVAFFFYVNSVPARY